MFPQKKMMGVLSILAAATGPLGFAASAQAETTYYVATTGFDKSGNGLDINHPFATIHYAAATIGQATGDTIQVAAGTYLNAAVHLNKMNNLTVIGLGNPILTAPDGTSQGQSGNYAIVAIQGCNNVTFTGFTIDGGQNSGFANAGTRCGGIVIVPYNNVPSTHISIRYNTVRNMGGSGIGSGTNGAPNYAYGADYVDITGNTVSNACATDTDNGSSINLQAPVRSDDGGGFHNVIQGNRVCNSYNNQTTNQTDGNGIIIDTAATTGGNTLIQNNIVYSNSGRGIYALNSSNVTILNNTCYQNCRNTALLAGGVRSIGEIVVYMEGVGTPPNETNINVYNNIAQTRQVGSYLPNDYVAVRVDNTGKQFPMDKSVVLSPFNAWWTNQNNLGLLYSVPTLMHIRAVFGNSSNGDFSEQPTSPTIDIGTNADYASSDFIGTARPLFSIVDLGAYESKAK